jgi:hypothetical protein
VLFQTKDGGQNWSLVDSGTSTTIWDLSFSDPSTGCMMTIDATSSELESGKTATTIYKTNDGGKTWGNNPILADNSNNSNFASTLVPTYSSQYGYHNHYTAPNLFLDFNKRVWFNNYSYVVSSFNYFHDGAFENILRLGQAHTYVASDRVYFLVLTQTDNGTYNVKYSTDYSSLKDLGPDFKSPTQIQRSMAVTNVCQFGSTIRVFSKYTTGKYYFMDSSDQGNNWTDPADIDGIVPQQIQAFDGTHFWGYDKGSIFRSGL